MAALFCFRFSVVTMRYLITALCLALAVGIQGCATPRYSAELFEADANAPYTLGSGDRLRVVVYGQDSLSNSYAVDGTGHISMPLIGRVPAQNVATQTLARNIEGRLRAGFLRDPKVSVEVEAYRPFFILGEVATAGQYPYVNGMTVQTAVAIAGGFSPRAAKSYAVITRVIDGAPLVGKVPITHPVRPGDTISVRERFF